MKTGFITLVGRPNAGKSSLLNAIIGEKVSIVSSRPQTTRTTIRGIYTDDSMQVVFLDTPGLHEGGEILIDAINDQAKRALAQTDGILRLIDTSRSEWEEDRRIDEMLRHTSRPVITVYSKGDLPRIRSIPEGGMVVSQEMTDFSILLERIKEILPEGSYLYDPDYYTDQSMPLRIAEIVREQAFIRLDEEVPHALFVDVETIEELSQGGLKILAYLHVEKESQKRILIGKNGAKITEIGMNSRRILGEIFERPIQLFLRVKVTPNWRKNTSIVRSLFPHA